MFHNSANDERISSTNEARSMIKTRNLAGSLANDALNGYATDNGLHASLTLPNAPHLEDKRASTAKSAIEIQSFYEAEGNTRVSSRKQDHDNIPKSKITSTISRMPSLDLSRTEQPIKVSYDESIQGPPGIPIPMVRTGGGIHSF
jgi:hypothetical protein